MSDSTAQSAPKRIAVIGAGVSGLATAHRLIELSNDGPTKFDVTLFEASDSPGGVAGTRKIGDYLVETGADMFITNQPAALNLCQRIGLSDELIPTETTHRGSLVLRQGKPVRIPEGFMLISPAKVWPVLTSSIFSPLGKLRMGLEYLLPRRKAQTDETLASFVKRRFGKEAFDRLIQPLVGGIYTADPDKLSLRATLPRFIEMEQKYRSLIIGSRKQAAAREKNSDADGSGARYGLFTAPRGGMSVLFTRLMEVVSQRAAVRFGERVVAVSANESGSYSVTLHSDEQLSFDGVVIALPAFHAASILEAGQAEERVADKADSMAELTGLLNEIEYSSAAVVVSGHRLSDIQHPLDAFGLVIPAVENRKVLAISFTSRKFPGRAPEGRILLRTFVGGALQPEMLDQSDEEILEAVRAELHSILGVGGDPDFMEVCWHKRSMPQYHVGHCERVARIHDLVAGHAGLELAGNAYSGVGIPDCILSGESAAERLAEQLA
ncbi:MAG: protoporphyrinogen oxidase [Planctomycetota bacterium]|nr:protoporphyrinogen oxidase [Planctomycetota bacterium]